MKLLNSAGKFAKISATPYLNLRVANSTLLSFCCTHFC
ncbi:hypothetical protein CAMRE0001_3264 [Campylobacter rectus RM3267]|uniref:Uncharacterized protein n=1 Tax=Campylobacter rectus RM3267 TaxID=553218 RepID=B9D5L6_CAMRE|nr:hypothetical protein CAMRE0001_3264 [Campylobacter rectus RM3267]